MRRLLNEFLISAKTVVAHGRGTKKCKLLLGMGRYSFDDISSGAHPTFSKDSLILLSPFGKDRSTCKVDHGVVILDRFLPETFLGWVALQIGNPWRNFS
jgi:hypothetical protein